MSVTIGEPDSFTVPSAPPTEISFAKVTGRIGSRRLDFEFMLFESLLLSYEAVSGVPITEEALISFFLPPLFTCESD